MKTTNSSPVDDLGNLSDTPLGRVLAIIDLMADIGLISVADIVSMLKIPRATANRYLLTLDQFGLIQKSPYYGKYCFSEKAASLAHLILSSTAAYAPMRSLLTGLSRRIGESTNISVMSLGRVQFVATSETATRAQHIQAGMRVPLYTSAVGHVFLAHMKEQFVESYLKTGPWQPLSAYTITNPEDLKIKIEQVRKDGFAINNSGYLEGIIGAAVPILDPNGKILAALALYASSREKKPEEIRKLIPTMLVYANRIARTLRT